MEATESDTLQIEAIYPLSPLQEGLLCRAQSVSRREADKVQQLVITINQAVHVPAWKQAWQTIIDRHPILRTAFLWERLRQPVQVVLKEAELQWQERDLSTLDQEAKAEHLQEVLRVDRQTGVDWKKPPLMRCGMIRMATDKSIFVWSYRPMVLDRWSAGLVLTETCQLYENPGAKPATIGDLPRPYREYVLWSRKQSMADAETFWRAALKGFISPCFWSHTSTRSEAVARTQLSMELQLAPSILSAIDRFKRDHCITFATLVQGAWGVVLARKLGRRDVLFGINVSGRSAGLAGVESMIGPFSNVLPVRARFDEGMDILHYLKDLQERHTAARRYEYASLQSILGWSSEQAPAMFDTLLVSEDDAKLTAGGIAGLHLQPGDLIDEDDFAVTLIFAEKPQMALKVLYDTASSAAPEIREVLAQIETLLERFVTSALDPVLESCFLDLLSQKQVFAEQNTVRSRLAQISPIQALQQPALRSSHPTATNGFEKVRDQKIFDAPIPKLADHRELPLSFGQQRLWFLDRLSPGNAAYNITAVLRLRGKLDHHALQKTLDEIVRRHEILRTRFQARDGVPSQSVAEPERVLLPVITVEGHAQSERESEAMHLAYKEGARPFDLSLPSPFRTTLVELGPQDNLLIIAMHHIVSDGWSSGLMTREFGLLYEAYNEGKPSPLQELPLQYADFAVWQRGWLNDQRLEEGLTYWKGQLRDAPVLQLPFARPHSSGVASGAMAYASLDADTLGKLKVLARSEGVTLFMALLSVFKLVLYVLTWQEDIVVGTDVANRVRPEVEPLIGFFTNQLVLRTDMSGNPSFQQVLQRVRATTLSAYRHQEVPFDKVVQTLAPAGRSGPSPFSPVKFVLQNFPLYPLQLRELTCEMTTLNNTTAKLPLLLTIAETGPGSALAALEYDASLFYGSTAARLLALFQRALTEVVRQPEISLHSVSEKLRSEEMEEHLRQSALDKRNLRSRLFEGRLSVPDPGI